MSAYEGCHSLYGQAKLEVEKKVLELKGWVLRPGLIVGKQAAGIVGSMQKLIKLTPIIPLIGSGNQILYLSHENDLIASIYQTVKSSEEAPFFSITTANATPRTFKEILIMLAQQHGRSPILIPLPWRAVWFLFKIMEIFKFSLSFRSDSIISLMYQNPSPDFSKEIVFFRDCKKL